MVDLEAWIDDLNIQAEHESQEVAESVTVAAAVDLQLTVQDLCSFEFSGLKMAIVASRDRLASRLANRLGDKKVPGRGKQYQARIIGIDQTAGKRVKFKQQKKTPRRRKESRRAKAS